MNLLEMRVDIYMALAILNTQSTLCLLFYVIVTTLLDVNITINPTLQIRK